MAQAGTSPGGTARNREGAAPGEVEVNTRGEEWREDVLWDPQTSGGLLISVRAEAATRLQEEMKRREVDARVIGEARPFAGARIRVD